MSKLDKRKNYSEIMGPGAKGKYVQNGVYFDREFNSVADDIEVEPIPVVTLKAAKPKAKPVPRKEKKGVSLG